MNNIQQKRTNDQTLFLRSVTGIYRDILGEKKGGSAVMENEEQEEGHAIFRILSYFGMKAPKIPHEKKEEIASYVMERSGLMMRKITLSKDWWKNPALPLLVVDEHGNQAAVLPKKRDQYEIYFGNHHQTVDKKLAASIQEKAYCFYKPIPLQETGMKALWKFLFQSFSASDLAVIVGISLFLELCGLILPYINSVIYNVTIPSGTVSEIPGIMVLLISSVIFSTLIGLSRSILVARLGNKMEIAGQSAILSRLFALPVPFFKRQDSGEIYNRISAVGEICEILGSGMIPTALTALLSVVYLFQISTFASSLLLPSIVIILLLLGNILLEGAMQMRRGEKENEVNNRVVSVAYQLLNGMDKIRTSGSEIKAFRFWSEAYKKMPLLPPYYLQISAVLGRAISLFGSAALYFLAWKSGLTASDFIAFQTAFSAFMISVMALADFAVQFGHLKPAVEMVRPLMEETPELFEEGEYVKELTGNIELSNVRFRYTKEMPYVINGLDLHIQAGEYLGIVGSSGCGKSTLMRLLMGFEVPETGSVYFDGKDIRGLDLPSLRRRIGVVLQDGKLFSGDILSNLSICAPDLSIDEAWDALRCAGLLEDVEQMPMGIYTMLSDGGGGLSGGQKQRLLIARAIASKPDILLFDEATSALDNVTQAIVVETLRQMKCTRIVIAHRLSTIKDCDRIIYLEKGQIVEEGNYESLMAQNGRFASIALRQLT